MALTYPEASSARRPGRLWTIRITGHSDRTASVTCSSACVMPPRSRDIAGLRRFAEAHALAHARAATVHAGAACQCRTQHCAAHEGTQTHCAGDVLLILRHDPAVGRVWTLAEVCSRCAPLMTHARVVGRAAPRMPEAAPRPAAEPPGPAATTAVVVPGGFRAPAGAGNERRTGPVRRTRGRSRPRRRAQG
ncbi:hypothetical protein GCM10010129_02780 [Streptomyces fumigatiscleroticus]|nr:hypothetical protein GCM10010129_02780 [Streptomyces fumigatiscleroticus]